MLRPYQSPASGTHCGPQCAQIPNLASRNQSGTRWTAASDCQLGAALFAPCAARSGAAAAPAAAPIAPRRVKPLIGYHPLALHAETLDSERDTVPLLEEDRRLLPHADSGRRAGGDDVAGMEGHEVAEI